VSYLQANIPIQFAYLDKSFLKNEEAGTIDEYLPVEIFSVTSLSRRCLLFNVMSEYGAQFTRVPIHYLKSKIKSETIYPLDWLQLWDCYSYYFNITRFEYLKNSNAFIILKNKEKIVGKYIFTIDWCNSEEYNLGYSEVQGGHKLAHVFWGENGQMFAQPSNRCLFRDSGAWISKKLPDDYKTWKVFSKEFTCEGNAYKWTAGDDELMFYEFDRDKIN
jgi:hypothetical protein